MRHPGKRLLGPEVNTSTHRELAPVVSPDGSTLWFTREGEDSTFMDGARQKAAAAVAELEAALAQLPAEQRQQMAAVLAQTKQQAGTPAVVKGVEKQTIFSSRRRPDGSWAPSVRADAPLNNDFSSSAVWGALPDGNTLLLGYWDRAKWFSNRTQEAAELSRGKTLDEALLAVAKTGASPAQTAASLPIPDPRRDDQNTIVGYGQRTASGWSPMTLLKIVGFAHLESSRSDFYLAPNGRALVMSIVNSESNAGSRDLFVSLLQPDGRWSKPAGLLALNSARNEISPWIAPDNKTIYFASARPGGLGEFDMWLSRRQDDSWLKWSAPVNLGPEINTPQADMNLAVDATGRYAFMSIGERGKEDIYEFELPPAMRPTPVAFVRGKVTDPSGKAVPAGILYELLRTAQGAGQASAEPREGRYQIALPIGEDYGFFASASGYLAVSDRLDLRAAKDQQVVERDLVLVPIARNVPVRLNNIFFETGKTTLLPESRAELNRLAGLLQNAPDMRIEIRGHTDAVDDDAFNQKLSDGRAAAVVAHLVQAGISAPRLRSRGFGESQPVAGNDTDKGRQQNRRVEFVIQE